jgi:hypothetical protein
MLSVNGGKRESKGGNGHTGVDVMHAGEAEGRAVRDGCRCGALKVTAVTMSGRG